MTLKVTNVLVKRALRGDNLLRLTFTGHLLQNLNFYMTEISTSHFDLKWLQIAKSHSDIPLVNPSIFHNANEVYLINHFYIFKLNNFVMDVNYFSSIQKGQAFGTVTFQTFVKTCHRTTKFGGFCNWKILRIRRQELSSFTVLTFSTLSDHTCQR